MHDDNLHINNNPENDFPQPEIPVDQAWGQMKTRLDAEMPASNSGSSSGNMMGAGGHFLNTALIVLGIGGILALSILILTKKDDVKKTSIEVEIENKIVISDSLSRCFNVADSNQKLSPNKAGSDKPIVVIKIEEENKLQEKNDLSSSVNKNQNRNIDVKKDLETLPKSFLGELKNPHESSTIGKTLKSDNPADTRTGEEKNSSRNREIMENETVKFYDSIDFKEVVAGNSPVVKIEIPQSTVATANSGDEKVTISGSGDEKETKSAFSSEVKNGAIPVNENDKPSESKPGTNAQTTFPTGKANDKTGKNEFLKTSHFGLMWNLPIPLQGTDFYFSGYKGTSQPYMTLIPAIWAGHRFNKHEILLKLNPYLQYFTGNSELSSTTSKDTTGVDTLFLMFNKTTYLHKTFGWGVGIRYNYEITPSFIIGTGVEYNFQSKALQREKITIQSTGQIVSDSLYGIQKSSDGWNYLNSGFIAGTFEVAWRKELFDLGACFTVPVTNLSSAPGLSVKPLNGQLFFRLKIR